MRLAYLPMQEKFIPFSHGVSYIFHVRNFSHLSTEIVSSSFDGRDGLMSYSTDLAQVPSCQDG